MGTRTGDSSEADRLNRNFAELLQELRVAQTGTQILLAFLLTIPFSSEFGDLSRTSVRLYSAAVCFAAVAMALLVSPVAIHRMVFRRQLKEHLVIASHWLTAGGLLALLFAVTASVLLVLQVAMGDTVGTWLAAGVAVVFVCAWGVLPAVMRYKGSAPD
jgi:hypothetical protein